MDHTSDLWRDALWLCPGFNHHHLKKLNALKIMRQTFCCYAGQSTDRIRFKSVFIQMTWNDDLTPNWAKSSKWIMQQTADSSLVNFLLLLLLGNNVGLIVMLHKIHKGVTISLFTRMCIIIIIIANLPAASFPSTVHPTWSVFTHALSPEPLRWSF